MKFVMRRGIVPTMAGQRGRCGPDGVVQNVGLIQRPHNCRSERHRTRMNAKRLPPRTYKYPLPPAGGDHHPTFPLHPRMSLSMNPPEHRQRLNAPRPISLADKPLKNSLIGCHLRRDHFDDNIIRDATGQRTVDARWPLRHPPRTTGKYTTGPLYPQLEDVSRHTNFERVLACHRMRSGLGWVPKWRASLGSRTGM